MAGNSEKIDEVIDPAALKQVTDLTDAVNALEKTFIASAKAAISLNNATGNAKTFKDYNQASTQASIETAKLQKIQTDAVKAAAKAEAEKQKIADQAAERLRKEAEAEQQKADRVAAIERTAAANSANSKNRSGGAYETGSSTQLSTDQLAASQARTQALADERAALIDTANADSQKAAADKMAADASNQATSSVLSEKDAVSASQKIVNQYTGSLADNSKRQVELSIQLKSVQDRLKDVTGTTSQAISARASLTAEETRLKAAIQQNSVVMRQQAKDELNATTSGDGLNARLTLLRTTYNQLTDSERANAQVGGVLLTEIKELDEQTKKIAESQGVYNKSVGDYENKIKAAISSYVPYGRQIVQGVDALKLVNKEQENTTSSLAKLGIGFASFTIAAFAVAIGSATYYLSLFQDTGNKVDIFLAGLKGRFAAFGQDVLTAGGGSSDKKTFLQRFFTEGDTGAIFKFLDGFEKKAANNAEAIQKLRIEYEKYNDVITQNISALDAQANLERATSKDRLLGPDARKAALDRAEQAETKALALAKARSEARISLAIKEANQYNKLSKDNEERLRNGDIQLAADLAKKGSKGGISIQSYEDLREAYAEETAIIGREATRRQRLISDRDNIELKQNKQSNNDQLALDRANIEAQKINSKLILDDDKQTFDARLAALILYQKKSKELIENERQTANSAPQISQTKIQANNVNAKTQLGQVDLEVLKARQKLYYDAEQEILKTFRDGASKLAAIEKGVLDNSLDVATQYTNQLKQDSQNSSDDQLQILSEQYAKGLIKAQDYQDRKKEIEGIAKVNQDDIDIAGLQLQYSIRLKLGESTSDVEKKLSDAKRKRDKDDTDNAISQYERDAAKAAEVAERKKKLQDAIVKDADAAAELLKTIVDAGFQNQLNKVQDEKDALTDRTKNEIDAENRSTDSAQTKADKIAVINAKAQAQQDQLDQKARAIKKKQAEADRLFAIAKIIETTALAVIAALAPPPLGLGPVLGIPFAIAAGALGAIQLATVLATPIPAYEKGTESAKGGLSIVGEAGKEYVLPPSGNGFFTPDNATLMDIPAGSKVIPHNELFKIMANPFSPRFEKSERSDRRMIEAINRGNNRLVKAFKQGNKRPIVFVDTMKSNAHNNKRNIHFK